MIPNNVNPTPLGQQLKQMREDKDRSAISVARAIYVTPKTIHSWESGRSLPSLDMLQAYLNEIGEYLVLGTLTHIDFRAEVSA